MDAPLEARALIWFGVFPGVLTRAPRSLARVPVPGGSLERFARFRQAPAATQIPPPVATPNSPT
jgi:hypothetical protein